MLAVSVEDYGKDLENVQALQRKQDEVDRDLTALHTQLEVRSIKRILFCISTLCPNTLNFALIETGKARHVSVQEVSR